MVETITIGVTTTGALIIYAALANWLVNINYAACCQLPVRKHLYIGLILALISAGYAASTRGDLFPGWIDPADVVGIIIVSAIMTAFQIWREQARAAQGPAKPQPGRSGGTVKYDPEPDKRRYPGRPPAEHSKNLE